MKALWDCFLIVFGFRQPDPIERAQRPSMTPEFAHELFSQDSTADLRVMQTAIEKIVWDRYWNTP